MMEARESQVAGQGMLQLSQAPVARTGMLIRRPVAQVYESFVDPALTSRFWFTRGSDRLEAGRTVQWEWEMYGVSIPVTVLALEPPGRIVIEWPAANGPTQVEWRFTPVDDRSTFVAITNAGFGGTGDEVVSQAMDAVGGFALVLAGLKALLEQGVALNLVADRYPRDVAAH